MTDQIVRCEQQTWRNTTNAEGAQSRVLIDNAAEKKKKDDEEVYALVLDRFIEFGSNKETVTLKINSPHILKALASVVKLHPSVSGDFTTPTEIKGPFQVLVYYWDEIFAYTEDEEDDDAHMHLNLLLDFLQSELGDKKKHFDYQHRIGYCSFSTLWAIFKPGELVYTTEKTHPRLLKIDKTAYGENTSGKYLSVHCVFTDHNGVYAGEGNQEYWIKQEEYFSQDDPAKIIDLFVYPRKYNTAGPELEASLAERGKKFIELSQGTSVQAYDGTALYMKKPPPSWFSLDQGQDPKTWSSYTESGRIVIDRKGFEEDHTVPKVTKKTPISEQLCPLYIYGYSCARKEWCKFLVPQIHAATWRPDPFSQLVMADHQKSLVRALVSSHHFPDNARDQSLQKGKGLVCLLHGSPGSGKTLTAECAAEHTQKALLSCTMSELNKYNYPRDFEEELARVLRLATAWKAIILLDEADVFLEARQDKNSTDRNALVAVLLKHMEYFSGVIFLTTNRIGVFDQAMKSRVHLALTFKSPDRHARRKIWAMQLQRLADDLDANLDKLLDEVQGEDMNGREIANAILTASTLARYQHQPLRPEHLETVMSVRRDFSNELKHAAQRTGSFPIRQNSLLGGALTEEADEM